MNKKIYVLSGFIIVAIFFKAFIVLDSWVSPDSYANLDIKGEKAWHGQIDDNPERIHVVLNSMMHDFDIHYVKNMPLKSHNPYFPGIHIVGNESCNAWLHVVRTDAKLLPEWRQFIDSWPKCHECYPFYTKSKHFLDAPLWRYHIFFKPLTWWVGHAYALHFDEDQKTITCLGGISWGYRLGWLWFKPTMILPTALTEQDWQTDWKVFEKELLGYKNI